MYKIYSVEKYVRNTGHDGISSLEFFYSALIDKHYLSVITYCNLLELSYRICAQYTWRTGGCIHGLCGHQMVPLTRTVAGVGIVGRKNG